MSGNGNGFEFLDILTIFSVLLQVSDHERETARMREDSLVAEKLDAILRNQEKILEQLADLG